MANGQSLATKAKFINGNVQLRGYDYEDISITLTKFVDWCKSNCKNYALMLHDADMKEDGVTPKNPHIHYICELCVHTSPRLSTSLGRIAKALSVDPFAVSIFSLDNLEKRFQYLIHKTEPQKHQYPVEYLICSYSDEERDALLNAEINQFDTDVLINIIATSYFRSDVLREIGLYRYRMYRGLINDLWDEFHNASRYDRRKKKEESEGANNA